MFLVPITVSFIVFRAYNSLFVLFLVPITGFKIVFIAVIRVINRPPSVQKITQGVLVKLTVIARIEESYKLQYQWFFKGTKYDIKPPYYVHYDPVTLTAYINTTKLTDEEYKTISGMYIREVFYAYDRVNITTKVVLV